GIKRELEAFGVKKQISIIPFGIDVDKTALMAGSGDSGAIFKRFNLGPDNEIVVFTSRLAKEKNIEFLLNAMKIVISSRPQVRFLIMGDGDHKESLRQTAEQL